MNKLEVKQKPTQEELFARIVQRIRNLYDHELSDVEAHEAARNLIEFVRILLRHAENN